MAGNEIEEDFAGVPDCFKSEDDLTITYFDIKVVVDFCRHHSIDLLRHEDYSYGLYVDGKGAYGCSLTLMNAIWYGILEFKKQNNGSST